MFIRTLHVLACRKQLFKFLSIALKQNYLQLIEISFSPVDWQLISMIKEKCLTRNVPNIFGYIPLSVLLSFKYFLNFACNPFLSFTRLISSRSIETRFFLPSIFLIGPKINFQLLNNRSYLSPLPYQVN